MSERLPEALTSYFRSGETWSADRERAWRMALRTAWIAAALLGFVAVVEAIALIVMLPLKTVVPYTLMVDRQTGYVQALKPLDREMIAPDKALTRSFLAQYVIAREGFDVDSLKDDYRKVTLWSAEEARARYVADMQATNPASRLAQLPRRALVNVEIRAMSSLGPNTSLVRFATSRADSTGQSEPTHLWQAVVTYRFTAAAMSAADRLTNPLGFQVTRYRRDAELAPPADLAQPVGQSPLMPSLDRGPAVGANGMLPAARGIQPTFGPKATTIAGVPAQKGLQGGGR